MNALYHYFLQFCCCILLLHLSVMFIVMESVFYKHQNTLTRFRHHTRRGQSPLTLKVIGEIVRTGRVPVHRAAVELDEIPYP